MVSEVSRGVIGVGLSSLVCIAFSLDLNISSTR